VSLSGDLVGVNALDGRGTAEKSCRITSTARRKKATWSGYLGTFAGLRWKSTKPLHGNVEGKVVRKPQVG